jgi:SAM-dependent methyltransferase
MRAMAGVLVSGDSRRMTSSSHAAEHWDRTYRAGETSRSWFQAEPLPSLRVLDAVGVSLAKSVIDVGGGTSRLVDALVARGHTDIAVLDVSEKAIDVARKRLGDSEGVQWLVEDVLTWTPRRRWDVWHDRAVLHFFTTPLQRERYLAALGRATTKGGVAVLATFAPDGPRSCSGLPVVGYDAAQLGGLLGRDWALLMEDHQEHVTPGGSRQPFTWAAFRRLA